MFSPLQEPKFSPRNPTLFYIHALVSSARDEGNHPAGDAGRRRPNLQVSTV